MPPKRKDLTSEEKQNLTVRWYLDVQSRLHVLQNPAEDEYEDMGQILNAVYFQRHSFAGQKMDWVRFTLVGGEKMPLSWSSGTFFSSEAHPKFCLWATPQNLGKDWGNNFLILALYDLL